MHMMHNWSVLPMAVTKHIQLFQDGADSASLAVVAEGMHALHALLLALCDLFCDVVDLRDE